MLQEMKLVLLAQIAMIEAKLTKDARPWMKPDSHRRSVQ
jgi:hypothetical protein